MAVTGNTPIGWNGPFGTSLVHEPWVKFHLWAEECTNCRAAKDKLHRYVDWTCSIRAGESIAGVFWVKLIDWCLEGVQTRSCILQRTQLGCPLSKAPLNSQQMCPFMPKQRKLQWVDPSQVNLSQDSFHLSDKLFFKEIMTAATSRPKRPIGFNSTKLLMV